MRPLGDCIFAIWILRAFCFDLFYGLLCWALYFSARCLTEFFHLPGAAIACAWVAHQGSSALSSHHRESAECQKQCLLLEENEGKPPGLLMKELPAVPSVCRVTSSQHILFQKLRVAADFQRFVVVALCHLGRVFFSLLPPASPEQTRRCCLLCLQGVPLQPQLGHSPSPVPAHCTNCCCARRRMRLHWHWFCLWPRQGQPTQMFAEWISATLDLSFVWKGGLNKCL